MSKHVTRTNIPALHSVPYSPYPSLFQAYHISENEIEKKSAVPFCVFLSLPKWQGAWEMTVPPYGVYEHSQIPTNQVSLPRLTHSQNTDNIILYTTYHIIKNNNQENLL